MISRHRCAARSPRRCAASPSGPAAARIGATSVIDFAPLGLRRCRSCPVRRPPRLQGREDRPQPALAASSRTRSPRSRWRRCNSTTAAGAGMLTLDGSGEVPVDRRQPDARWHLRPAAAQGRPRLRLARGAQHHRRRACRPGRLRAADDRDLERQGGHGDRQRRHRRRRRRQDAAQHRAGALRRAAAPRRARRRLSASSPAPSPSPTASPSNQDLRLVSP